MCFAHQWMQVRSLHVYKLVDRIVSVRDKEHQLRECEAYCQHVAGRADLPHPLEALENGLVQCGPQPQLDADVHGGAAHLARLHPTHVGLQAADEVGLDDLRREPRRLAMPVAGAVLSRSTTTTTPTGLTPEGLSLVADAERPASCGTPPPSASPPSRAGSPGAAAASPCAAPGRRPEPGTWAAGRCFLYSPLPAPVGLHPFPATCPRPEGPRGRQTGGDFARRSPRALHASRMRGHPGAKTRSSARSTSVLSTCASRERSYLGAS